MDNIKPQILSRMVSGVIVFGRLQFFTILVSYHCVTEIVMYK